ncbi:MAG: hypothetical protein ACREH6_15165, partial [Geminicoccaceae bacterium]
MQRIPLALLSGLLVLATTTACTRSTGSAQFKDNPAATCGPDTEICRLNESGPIVATHDGQVIEGLRIRAVSEPGILVRGLSNVIVRNVEIFHEGADGILCDNAPGLTI